MISKWNYLPLTSEQKQLAAQLATHFPDCPTIGQLLVLRGINSWEETSRFFEPSLSHLHDPFLMSGMREAVDRLNEAMGNKEKILVFGDYDVDGITAVALVYKYLQNYYSNVEYYIPTRYEEGYGISKKCIDYAESIGVSLMIVLDCGIKATAEVNYAKQCGIDFIICDHHMPDDELPQAVAILNPKLEGNPYPFKDLCGCGVGFKFMQAFAQSNCLDNNDLEALLDLVAVSIAADIVPIMGENRVLTHFGLKRINANPNMGLRSIMRICGMTGREITINDVIFKIGPRINASGRMQSGMEAVSLLVTHNAKDAFERSKAIDQYNKDRKELDKRITEEASAILSDRGEIASSKRPIVIYNKNWHNGIIGIVASRLTEEYFKPTVVLTLNNGLATGSSRSVHGFDIYKAVDSVRDLLENFGGHTYAVGLSLKEENIPEFTRRFEQYVIDNIENEQLTPQIDIDCEIEFARINKPFIKMLNKFNPIGPANQRPVFATSKVTDTGNSHLVGHNNEHIKLEITDPSGVVMDAIAFNMAEHFEHITAKKPFKVCYTIEENKRQPGVVQLQIKDIRPQ